MIVLLLVRRHPFIAAAIVAADLLLGPTIVAWEIALLRELLQ